MGLSFHPMNIFLVFGILLACISIFMNGMLWMDYSSVLARNLGNEFPCVHPHLLRTSALSVAFAAVMNLFVWFEPTRSLIILIATCDGIGFAYYVYAALIKGTFSIAFLLLALTSLGTAGYFILLKRTAKDELHKD